MSLVKGSSWISSLFFYLLLALVLSLLDNLDSQCLNPFWNSEIHHAINKQLKLVIAKIAKVKFLFGQFIKSKNMSLHDHK